MSNESHPHLIPFRRFLEEFNRETDRGAALTAAAMIDDLIGKTVEAFLADNKGSRALLSGFNAPLGTFAAKIAAAYAMGLLSEREYRECELIRKIRNEFAHKVHVSLSEPPLSDMCGALTYCVPDDEGYVRDARTKLTSSAASLILNLTKRPFYAGMARLEPKDWPY